MVEVVTDDMPFLVDSVTMELARQDRDVHARDPPAAGGRPRRHRRARRSPAVEDGSVAAARGRRSVESWMHVEIDRVDRRGRGRPIEAALPRVLRDVREAVEDWPKMQRAGAAIVDELGTDPPPLPGAEVAQGQELLRWLADDHFTFLGYREYHLEPTTTTTCCAPSRHRARHPRAPTRTCPPRFGKLPPAVRAQGPREEAAGPHQGQLARRPCTGRPTSTTSASRRSTRPARSSASAASSGCSLARPTPSRCMRIPVLREKAREVLERAGFDPHSHSGKALLDILETYPRDELFQTPVDELAADRRRRAAPPGAPAAAALRPPRRLRPLRLCLVYLPRDRYTTNVRERMREILREQLGGETHRLHGAGARVGARPSHFVVRPPRARRSARSTAAELEQQLAEATRSWGDDFVSAAMAAVRRGPRRRAAPGCTPTRSPRPTRRTSRRRSARPTSAGSTAGSGRRATASTSASTAATTPTPGERRFKVFRTGSPLSLSHVLPMLSSMGVEVVDERPYELGRPRPARPGSTTSGCATTSGTGARARPTLFQDALRAVWDGAPRATASTGWCSTPG